jgi:hypothetical protein
MTLFILLTKFGFLSDFVMQVEVFGSVIRRRFKDWTNLMTFYCRPLTKPSDTFSET